MKDHRHPDEVALSTPRETFGSAVRGVFIVFGQYPFRRFTASEDGGEYDRNLNRAVFDIQILTLGMIEHGWLTERHRQIEEAFRRLCTEDQDFTDSVSRATADKRRFDYRVSKWAQALENLGAALEKPELIPDTPLK